MISNDYLKPTFFIDYNSPKIKDLAREFSNGVEDKKEIAKKIFSYVRDSINYTIVDFQYDNREKYKASATLSAGRGWCIPKSIISVALMRANDIPARLHFADIINHRSPKYLHDLMGTNIFYFHGYFEIYLEDKWIKLTPSFETSLCERHNFPICEFDGINDAIFKPTDNLGQPFVEYINDRGVYADLPFQEMLNTFLNFYGRDLHYQS
ncbi:MAG: transglutaminase family protein [Candidatus Hodarchaeota archaeon]